jgi:hypothetical protein
MTVGLGLGDQVYLGYPRLKRMWQCHEWLSSLWGDFVYRPPSAADGVVGFFSLYHPNLPPHRSEPHDGLCLIIPPRQPTKMDTSSPCSDPKAGQRDILQRQECLPICRISNGACRSRHIHDET